MIAIGKSGGTPKRGMASLSPGLGLTNRMLVIDGKLEAVSKRVPGHIVGDGKHTAAELIDIVNCDPRRGVGHEKVLTSSELDKTAKAHLAEA